MDRELSPRGNAPGRGSGGASSSKHKNGGGGKKPIKVLYIANPMRVQTSAEGFRALVQELTGQHADPSKYSPGDLDSGAAAQGLSPRARVADVSSETIVASHSPGSKAAPHGGDYYDVEEDEDDVFRSPHMLLENNYTVFSPPTLLYDHHPHSKGWVVATSQAQPQNPSMAPCYRSAPHVVATATQVHNIAPLARTQDQGGCPPSQCRPLPTRSSSNLSGNRSSSTAGAHKIHWYLPSSRFKHHRLGLAVVCSPASSNDR
uniref:VQ domain-containing protein n=1 Tax=Zea mays TaxID=4577 RepID=A0A804LEA6_MAIZE